jgi:hypothetical protein
MSGAVTSMYSANALYFSLVIKSRIRAEALSSLETIPTPSTKRRSAFMAVMMPLRSTRGACIAGGVARAVLGDEAVAARAMRRLRESGGKETSIPSTVSRIAVNSFTIRVFVGDMPIEFMRSVASSICVMSMSKPFVVSKSPLKKTDTSFRCNILLGFSNICLTTIKAP